MSDIIPKPGIYRHFKGNMYELLYTATNSETLEKAVVYRALYGERGVWVRPLSMWSETVEHDGKAVPRFEYVGNAYGDAEIIINIRYTGESGSARKFAREMTESGIVDDIKSEQGNLQYEYFFPADGSETVLLLDRWKNQASLDLHHASPMMERITALREKYNLHMTVERFVSDKDGVPDSDKAYIKG